MSKVRGEYWKTGQSTVKIQIRTNQEQHMIEEVLPGWTCVSFGYVPKTSEDIYVFEKNFDTESDWTKFLNSDKVNTLIEMREILND